MKIFGYCKSCCFWFNRSVVVPQNDTIATWQVTVRPTVAKLDLSGINTQREGVRHNWSLPVQPLENDDNFNFSAEQTDQSDFSFENVKKHGLIKGINYQARFDVENGTRTFKRPDEKTSIEVDAQYGWKFHIALNDSEENMRNSWDALIPVLRRYKLNLFKLLPSRTEEFSSHQDYKGREGTLYVYREALTLNQWQELLQEIENTLLNNNIEPGIFSTKCQSVSGSKFFCYRFDGDSQGNYMPIRQADSYKPDSIADPFYEKIVIQAEAPNMRNN